MASQTPKKIATLIVDLKNNIINHSNRQTLNEIAQLKQNTTGASLNKDECDWVDLQLDILERRIRIAHNNCMIMVISACLFVCAAVYITNFWPILSGLILVLILLLALLVQGKYRMLSRQHNQIYKKTIMQAERGRK